MRTEADHTTTIARAAEHVRPTPVRELRDSLILLGFVASSLGAYVALGAVVVKLLAGP